MARTNPLRTNAATPRTHEGARTIRENPLDRLSRVMNAHMLWEDTFYLDGQTSADVLTEAVQKAVAHDWSATRTLIVEARTLMNIRHASLKAAVEYAKARPGKDAIDLIQAVINRADELAEVLAMGAKGPVSGPDPIRVPSSIRKGVQRAFDRFDEYQFAKYQGGKNAVTLRDAVFITHPSPKLQPLVQKIVDGTLAVPDTWETGLSMGGDKREVFEKLLREDKLGAMALLRNLRNMDEAGVDPKLVTRALLLANWSKVLPFRFMSAVKASPKWAPQLDKAFLNAVAGSDPLPGKTAVLVDHSWSMTASLSKRSSVSFMEAGNALAAAVHGDVDMIVWGTSAERVPAWPGLAGAMNYRGHVGFGTNPNPAIAMALDGKPDRIILITDMQFADTGLTQLPRGVRGYTINLSPYGNAGLLAGKWTHFTGFSQNVLKFIAETERGAA